MNPNVSSGTLRVAIILNGISLKKKFFYTRILPPLSKIFHVDVFETRTRREAIPLASKAVDNRYDVVLAAGGDGTLNQVLNGMLQERESDSRLPALGVIPLGSGNDFARTLNITTDTQALIEMLKTRKTCLVDVGKIQYQTEGGKKELSYFINVADAGMGPEVVNRMTNSGRAFGAGWAYYMAILSTFFSYRPMNVHIQTPEWTWRNKLRTLAVGNGKFYGHGLCIAPDARTNDGVFSCFTCGDVSVIEFIWYSGHLKNSKKIEHTKVTYSRATHLDLTSESPCRIEGDGELLGLLPATIDILPERIKFLC